MPRFRVVVRSRKAVLSDDVPLSVFDEVDLGRTYFPGRGLFYSILIHIAVFIGLFFLSLFRSYPDPPLLVNRIAYVHPRLPKVLAYLPVLQSSSQFMRFPAPKKAEAGAKKPSAPKAARTKGLSYPGPQLIVSDVPKPTNEIQTVLQPDLANPPILVPPLPLPNIVQLAELIPPAPKALEPPPEPPKEAKIEEPPPVKAPDPPPETKQPEPPMTLPALELAKPTRMEAPRLILPPSIPPVLEAKPADSPDKLKLPEPMKAAPPPPEPAPTSEPKPSAPPQKTAEPQKVEPASKTSAKPKSIPAAESSASPNGKKNLLSLTPMPSSSKDPAKVPPGEARGRFVISPEPNLAASEKDPGVKTGIRSATIAVAKTPSSSEGEAAANNASAFAAAGDTKTANDKSTSVGGNGANTAVNAQPGSSPGTGGRAAYGPAQGSAKKPFAGITIVGGAVEPGDDSSPAPVAKARRPLQTAYGLNIISTEDSGGGLPYVGVFSHEQIYTVYLDMRQSEEEQDPSWILEFAIIQQSTAQANSPGNRGWTQQGLILPFPVEKERPVFPEELVRKHLNRMILIYGVINLDGKLEQLSIKESPEAQLNESVIQALSKWTFRPAQLNGERVAAKVLMGIPLWLSE